MPHLRRAASPPQGQPLRCPRCGYDLSGAARALGLPTCCDAAPAQVQNEPDVHAQPQSTAPTIICSECGLDTPWIDVLDPARRDIPWLYEHTLRRRIGLRRAWRTLLRSLVPWRFWLAVGLSSRLSVARLLLYLPALIVPLHVIRSVATLARRWLFVLKVPFFGTADSAYYLAGSFSPPFFEFGPTGSGGWFVAPPSTQYTFVAPLAAGLLMPVLLLILSRTRATARIRHAHILRAGVYGLAWLPLWYLLGTLVVVSRAVEEWATSSPLISSSGRWSTGFVLNRAAPVAVGLCLAWFAAWWWCVVAIGFRLPRAGRVWAALMTACLLLALLAALLDRNFEYWFGGLFI